MEYTPKTADEHYQQAESILAGVEAGLWTNHVHMLRLAQVHATLALRPNPLISSDEVEAELWEQQDWENRQAQNTSKETPSNP